MQRKTKTSFLELVPLLHPHIRRLGWGILFMVIYVSCWPVLAWLAGQLIPSIGEGNLTKVFNVVSISLLVFLIQKVAQFLQDILLAAPALRVSQELRKQLFFKLQRLELSSLEKLSSGDITYRLTEDADRVGEVVYKTIQDTTPSLMQLIAVFGYMLWLDINLSIATVLLTPLVAILVSMFGSKVLKAAENSQKQVSDLAALIVEAIQGIPLVRAYAAERWLEDRFEEEINLHREAKYKNLSLLALQHPVVGFIEAAGILAVLIIGAVRIKTGELNTEGFSSYVAALLMLIDPISHLTSNFNELKQGQASLERLKEIENRPKEPLDLKNPTSIGRIEGHIEFKNISFSYKEGLPVINNLSLKIKAGEVVALVGSSGAGKSTLFSLLLRFYTTNKGIILLDGNDINTIKSKEMRRQIGLVPQQINMFSGSIAEAIRIGRKLSDSEIIEAAKIANAHEFIMKLPQGYSTLLQERGTNLSGGQLQRIAIARAVLGNPSLLLLDEATSALDAEAEASVQVGLKQAMKNRTVIIIAHRLATVQEADLIVVMHNGTIIDSGTHNDLLRREGAYKELCERQMIKDFPTN